MHYSPLRHGAAGPFDKLILLVEAIRFLTFSVLIVRARLRRRLKWPGLKAKNSQTQRSEMTRSG